MKEYEDFWGRIIPLLVRRGGRDIKKMLRSLLRWSGRGGGSYRRVFLSHHPVCADAVAARLFLTGAATLPHEEGNKKIRKRLVHVLCAFLWLILVLALLDWWFPLPTPGRNSPYAVIVLARD